MATTTNYGWTTPDDTALVKDGAAAIRSLGTSIDTTVFNNASAGIPKTIVDAKGDLIAATAADTVSRLAVGANDTVLTADSTTATGLKWATAAGGGETLLSTTTLSGSSTTISSISTTYKHLRVVILGLYANVQDNMSIRFNGDTGSFYNSGFSYGSTNSSTTRVQTSAVISQSYNIAGISFETNLDLNILRYSITSGQQLFTFNGWNGQTRDGIAGGGIYTNKSAAITSITFIQASGTFTAGTVYIYGVN
jgi:hypothetical protein